MQPPIEQDLPPAGDAPSPEFQQVLDRVRSGNKEQARQSLEALAGLGISSYSQVAEGLPDLRDEALVAAIWALRYFDRRKTVPLVLSLLRSPEPCVRGYALSALEMIRSPRAVPAYVYHLEHDPDPWVREKAAHGLGFLFNDRYDDAAFPPLLRALESGDEPPAVRAQAAEGIGNILAGSDRRARRFKCAQRALIRALDHPSPEIRFWSAFALGSMRSNAALPRLRQLAETDTAVCPLWWPVKDEASDAIECILTGGWPDHDRPMQR